MSGEERDRVAVSSERSEFEIRTKRKDRNAEGKIRDAIDEFSKYKKG